VLAADTAGRTQITRFGIARTAMPNDPDRRHNGGSGATGLPSDWNVRHKIAGSAEARRKAGYAARAVPGARAALRC